MSERRRARRTKSFLRGFVYVSRQQGALACLIRDMSDTGARIVFSDTVTLPNTVDLYIPQREQTLHAKVRWRHGDEVGLAFAVPQQRSADATMSETEVVQRVAMLEAEIDSLRSVLKRLKREKADRADDRVA
ncbi:MAG TPA: PilZ domain-containing protein [Xanthobacteraceae bacterium]|nr:PilZ domain-containing protein [Xanthobacteraceae bacterium]